MGQKGRISWRENNSRVTPLRVALSSSSDIRRNITVANLKRRDVPQIMTLQSLNRKKQVNYRITSCLQNRISVRLQAWLLNLPGSNLGRNTSYPDWWLSWQSLDLPGKCRDTTPTRSKPLPNPFHLIIHQSSSFTNHPILDAMQSHIWYWQPRKINHTNTLS
jgi:hypothetical protein